jgi:hypothetical protein
MNEEITMTAMPEDTAPETDSTSAMEDDWDDIDLSGVTDDDTEGAEQEETPVETETEPSEADQQTEEHGDAQREEAPAAEEPAKQTFDLKFLGETKTVSKDEVITLAQKGLNYDKILGERDVAKQEVSRLQEYESFLKELAGPDGMSIEDLIDSTRAEVLAKKDGIDKAAALRQIKLDRREKALEAKQSKDQAEAKAKEEKEKRKQDDLLRFVTAYPDVKAQEIPKEVWDNVHSGTPLVTAYSIYENKRLREEVKSWKDKAEIAEQNYKNQQRSTGSQSTAGVGTATKKDPIDLDWYSGD